MKLIALDVGEKRIGVAKADTSVKIAVPLSMVPVDGQEISNIIRICQIQDIDAIVVGMPRNLNGQTTAQSDYVKNFANELSRNLQEAKPNRKDVKIYFQDESLTSVQAKENLNNRKGGINKKAGDVDMEAATIILQDFLENVARRIAERQKTVTEEETSPAQETEEDTEPKKKKSKRTQKNDDIPFESISGSPARRKIMKIVAIIGAVVVLGCVGIAIWYNSAISAIDDSTNCKNDNSSTDEKSCTYVEFAVEDGSTVSTIADLLKKANLIKSSLAFKVFAKLAGNSNELKAGSYKFAPFMSVSQIYAKLLEGSTGANVFTITIKPGETLAQIKQTLLAAGYSASEIESAFSKNYVHPVLRDKPASASLEGYLFGETYEFYKGESVENIIERMLDELYSVVKENDLINKFAALGYDLHEGIIIASIVQKEAGVVSEDNQKKVAQVFWTRLKYGMALGSDVTASYAADQVDPARAIYTDNASVLDIDSCYNTRKYSGLPCGPISNPGATVLISTANPADTTYLYFLTGDDYLMYYSSTEDEHLQNIYDHCQVLCNAQL